MDEQAPPRPTAPFLVPLLRWIASLGPEQLDRLDLVAAMVSLTDHTSGRQAMLDSVMRPIRQDARRRFSYESMWRASASLARTNVDLALARNPAYAARADKHMLYDGAVDLVVIRTLAHLLTEEQWNALWGPYERELPELRGYRTAAFVFESADELESVLRTPHLAEVAIVEGGIPRDQWDLRCRCGAELIPFGWQSWRQSECDFCQDCPTIAFIEPPKESTPESVHFMQVFARGHLDSDWPPQG